MQYLVLYNLANFIGQTCFGKHACFSNGKANVHAKVQNSGVCSVTGKTGSELEAGVGEVCEQGWEEENAYRDLRVMQGEICLLEF